MPKANLFRSLTSFRSREVRVFFSRSCVVHHNAYCVIRKQSTDLSSKILISIPKSIGSAPYRNLYKRRIKHIFYEEGFFNSTTRWGIFFKKNALMPPYEVLKELMIDLMKV